MTKKREMTKCHQYAIRLINKYINSCVFIFINWRSSTLLN